MQYDPWAWVDRRLERVEATASDARSTASDALRKTSDLSPRLERLERDRATVWIAARVVAAVLLLTSSLSPDKTGAIIRALIEALAK